MAEDSKDAVKALNKVANQLHASNKKAEKEAKKVAGLPSAIRSIIDANKDATKEALDSGNTDLVTALKAERGDLWKQFNEATADLASKQEEANVAKAIDEANIIATFGSMGAYQDEIRQQQNQTLAKLSDVNKDIESTRLEILKKEEKLKKAEEKKDKKAFDKLTKEIAGLKDGLKDKNEKASELKTEYDKTKDESGVEVDDESAVQVDPNQTPDWALKLTESFDLSNLLTKEGFENMGDRLGGLASKIGNSKVGQAAKGLFDVFADLAKKVFIVIGGFTALNGFLDGMKKTTEWFGEGAGFKETIAAGIAGLMDAFGLAGEGGPAELAHKIVAVFDWMQEKIEWMFAGVKKTFGGIATFIGKFSEGMDQMANGNIIDGLGTILGSFGKDLLGNISMGFVAAFALFAPKLTAKILWWGLKTIVPKVLSLLWSVGSAIFSALAPLAVAAAPFIAIAAAIALVIGGIVSGFKEGMAIFEETGSILEGLKAGFSKMVGFIYGFIPDLLKDLVSWAARALGFDNFADTLDSFSFVDMVTDAFRNVFNWFEKFPLLLKKGLLALMSKLPVVGGRFAEDLAAVDAQLAAKDAKFAKTDDAVNKRREDAAGPEAAELAAEKAEEGAEKLEAEKPEKKGGGWFGFGGGDDDAAATPMTSQTVQIESKPIAEGLKAMEKAMVGYLKSIDEEIKKQNSGGNTVVSAKNSKVVNNSTTAVAMGFGHRNIGATRGMFGAPSSPLTPPS